MFFRIIKIIIFFLVVAFFEIVGIFLYRPSLMIDAYRGVDEKSIWIESRCFDFQRKVSDTDQYKFYDLQWSPNGRYFSYYDFVRLEQANKEWALKIFDARFFKTKIIFIGPDKISGYEWLDDNNIRVHVSTGVGVKAYRDIDMYIKQPIIAVDDYSSGAWTPEKTFHSPIF